MFFTLRSFLSLFFWFFLIPTSNSTAAFNLVALGVNGGLSDGNLSAYLVKPLTDDNYVALDAGTLVQGLIKAFHQNSVRSSVLTHHIPAYLISHAHLDHLMGFVMAQPELRNQQVLMARDETMQALQTFVFNWSVWGNFGDAGEKPQLHYQHYQTIPLFQWIPIPNTEMSVKAFPLNHGNGFLSTAFLLNYKQDYLLYFGDTGADEIEHAHAIQDIWDEIAPLIRAKQLHAILLECSFPNAQPQDKLFGHLNPHLYMNELRKLAYTVNKNHPESALQGLTVFVTHVKPTLDSLNNNETAKKILNEIEQENDLAVNLVLPVQGEQYRI